MESSESQKSVRELVLAIFEANGRLVDTGNTLMRPMGLTAAWWQVLGALGYSAVPLPVAQIARNMGLTRQAVQRVADLLVEHGFVVMEPNPHHRRAQLVVITPAGRAVLTQAEEAVLSLDRRIFARVGPERLSTAIEVLRDLKSVLDEVFEADHVEDASNT